MIVVAFRRGFKTWCENTAKGFRRDLRMPIHSPLDPRALAKHLDVLIWTPEEVAKLGKLDDQHLEQLLVNDPHSWSAVTLIMPHAKLIILNSQHAPTRQNSDIMHELSHLVLEHSPSRVDMTPKRLMILDTYDKVQEEEANWLSGALLVPRDGLLSILSKNPCNVSASAHFDVSQQMLSWRRQVTGIDAQLRHRLPSVRAE